MRNVEDKFGSFDHFNATQQDFMEILTLIIAPLGCYRNSRINFQS